MRAYSAPEVRHAPGDVLACVAGVGRPAAQLAMGARMTVRILRWAACCVAAVSVALLVGGVALSYADRHLVPASGWDFSSVFEDVTFMAIPGGGLRPGVQAAWERGRLDLPGAGLVDGLGFSAGGTGSAGWSRLPGRCRRPGRPRGS
jgi:hypothetical protein